MEFGKKRVFKQEEQPLRVCGKNWVWFDPVLNVLISHVGLAAFTLCHFEVIFGVLPSKGCCTAHALAVQWTHIFLLTSNTEGRSLFLQCTLQTVPLKTSCSQQRKRFWHVCPRIQGEQLKWEEKQSKMWEGPRAAWWSFFKCGGRLRCAFVWKFLLPRTVQLPIYSPGRYRCCPQKNISEDPTPGPPFTHMGQKQLKHSLPQWVVWATREWLHRHKGLCPALQPLPRPCRRRWPGSTSREAQSLSCGQQHLPFPHNLVLVVPLCPVSELTSQLWA